MTRKRNFMSTRRQGVSKAMWLIRSFKSVVPCNVILISNFYRIAFH